MLGFQASRLCRDIHRSGGVRDVSILLHKVVSKIHASVVQMSNGILYQPRSEPRG